MATLDPRRRCGRWSTALPFGHLERAPTIPRTSITLLLSEPCWLLLRELNPEETRAQLNQDLRHLWGTPRLDRDPTSGAPRYATDILPVQINELIEFVDGTYRALAAHDPRRQVCERCLEDIERSIKRQG
jgi:hypothetical protein